MKEPATIRGLSPLRESVLQMQFNQAVFRAMCRSLMIPESLLAEPPSNFTGPSKNDRELEVWLL